MLSTCTFTESFELHHDTNSGRADWGPTLQPRRCNDGGNWCQLATTFMEPSASLRV
jgi:hypothetical protein